MSARVFALFTVFSGPCVGSTSSNGGGEPLPTISSLEVCPDGFQEGTAYADGLWISGDDVVAYVEWTGCEDDSLQLCWSGEYDEGVEPLTTELFVDFRPASGGWCGDERGKTLRSHAFDLRLDAFNDGYDQIDFWLHGEKASYTW